MQLQPGQVAVVTGAASGIGAALATSLAARGLNVVLADIEVAALSEAVDAVRALGVTALGVPTDVSSSTQVDALAATTLAEFDRIDLVCNNAGVSTLGPPMWETPLEDWEWVLSVNLWGVIHGIRAFVPHLVAQGSGHVVNTASMAGLSIAPRHGPYVASKHAVVALSESLALELATAAPNVGVTVVCPGVVSTRIPSAERNRPGGPRRAVANLSESDLGALMKWASTISGPEISAHAAAEVVVAAIETNRLYAAPNGSGLGVHERLDRLLTDLEEDFVPPSSSVPSDATVSLDD